MIEKLFCSYEQSLSLKEMGFNESCLGYYDCERDFKLVPNKHKFLYCEVARPLKHQVYKWFWVYYHLSHNIFDWLDDFELTITEWSLCKDRIVYEYPRFETYEKAESVCIDKLIEIIKNK